MIYVFLAEGFEVIEALTPVDLLRRAGKEVITVGVGGSVIKGSHGIGVVCDNEIENVHSSHELEGVILPGGMPGTTNLNNSDKVKELVAFCHSNNFPVAAICAAPMILGEMGILDGKNAVCYPGFEKHLLGAKVQGSAVCTDGNVITACGAGAATKFALKLVEVYCGEMQAKKLEDSILCSR